MMNSKNGTRSLTLLEYTVILWAEQVHLLFLVSPFTNDLSVDGTLSRYHR